jgi:3-hydroxybutyryl-CoA dehydrogenase
MGAIERVSVIGSGLMGHAIALEFAVRGFPVQLYDSQPERVADAHERVRRTAQALVGRGVISDAELDAGIGRLTPTGDLAAACAEADYVAEAVPEDLSIKRAVFAELDALCPAHTILASNTSSFLPSLLADATQRADRVIVAHYFNPPHLIPVVEVVRGPQTSAETADATADLLRRIGKTPAILRKEAPGFIANRLQSALIREAISLVEQGVAEPEDIDAVVRLGFGRRLAVFGPFTIADLAGLDVYASMSDVILPTLDRSESAQALLRGHAAAGELGAKSGQGFYAWPREKLEAALAKRDAELLRRLAEDAQ